MTAPLKTVWRSTKLGKIDRNCLAVLCFEEAEDRRIYEPGKVAHYILEQAQRATNEANLPLDVLAVRRVAEESLKSAAEHGFTWEGQHEPPPRVTNAIRGRRFAENWMLENPLEPGFQAEVSVTLDRWGKAVERHDPNAWATMILDRAGVVDIETEESSYRAIQIDDHKSDWQSGSRKDDEGIVISLNNAQRRLQAMGGWALFEGEPFSAMVLVVNSLPRRWSYRRTLSYEEMGILDDWREELQAITDGYDARIARYGLDPEKLASPGAGCKGCPHLGECDPGREHLAKRKADDPPEKLALAYAAHIAEASRLRGYLVPVCNETGVVIAGSTEVGYEEKDETVVKPDAAEIVWRHWKRDHREGVDDAQDAFEKDLLQSYLDGLRLGVTELRSLLRKLWPGNRGKKPERERKMALQQTILEEATFLRKKPQFGVRKIEPEESPEMSDEELNAKLKRSLK